METPSFSKWLKPLLILAVSMAALLVLFFFAPTQYAFYPRCVWHSLTGLACPGCGALRAMHQLLHGHFREAFVFNPLFIVALPFLAVAALSQLWKITTGHPLFKSPLSSTVIWLIFSMTVAFTILRNLPGFSWPAP